MKYKRLLASVMAVCLAAGVSACGSSDSSSQTDTQNSTVSEAETTPAVDESFEEKNNVEVEETSQVDTLPGGEESTITYLGENDINPTRSNPEKSTDVTLFEQKGGTIKFNRVSNADRFDKLAASIASQSDIPDIFKYEWLAFPSGVVKGMYQPIDSIVDFGTDLWKSAKDTADQYMLGGEHYVAPLGYVASSMICYDKGVIEAESLDDPFELYQNGEWNWDNWKRLMSEYVSKAPADTQRYGVNGFFRTHIVQQTGKNLVTYNPADNTFASNLQDADIEKAQNFLYDMMKEGLILNDWIGSAAECFNQNILFYAMGEWAYTGNAGPADGEEWGVVPMPQYPDNPQKITTSDMTAFMWVQGSKKADAVKAWFDCCRIARTDPQYEETNKAKFMENNPNWTEEMYQSKSDAISDEYMMIFDYAFGVSSTMGDRNQFDGNQCLVDYIYNGASTQNEDGEQPTWTQIREQYSKTVEQELDNLNQKIKEFEESKK
ncbi:MAG: extracellular solute-binding protein [Ruminococcus sp.]|nr:extracellular solute-binding protein [Ruminococcus sp.]